MERFLKREQIFDLRKDFDPIKLNALKYVIIVSLLSIPFIGVLRNYYLGLNEVAIAGVFAEILMFVAYLFYVQKRYIFARSFTILGIAVILIGLLFQDIHYNYMWFAVFPLISFILYTYNVAVVISFVFLFLIIFLEFEFHYIPLWIRFFYIQELFIFYLFMVFGGYFYSRILMEHEAVMQHLATRDMLTGALNRWKFLKDFSYEFAKAKRFGLPLSLIMFDIDFFKKVNDTYGHDAGDMVLKKIVEIVKNSIRKIDKLVRWGGEEFIIFVPNTDLEGAAFLAEKLRRKIEEADFGKVGKVTVSFGVAGMRKGDTVDDLLKRVDEALYKAKQRGRNRVEIV